jgi:hypothetical protein
VQRFDITTLGNTLIGMFRKDEKQSNTKITDKFVYLYRPQAINQVPQI